MTFQYVNLKRRFHELPQGTDDHRVQRGWRTGEGNGGLSWRDVLDSHRFSIILGEAGIGKSKEFVHQAHRIQADGKAAFFLDITRLAKDDFELLFELEDEELFDSWISDSEQEGYFFLDAVDEAKLQDPQLVSKALRKLARALGDAASRSRLSVSCRVTDWRHEQDADLIGKELRRYCSDKADEEEPFKLFQLLPLTLDEVRALVEQGVTSAGAGEAESFIDAVRLSRAEHFTNRPLDVEWMFEHWSDEGTLGDLTDLIEHGINKKIRENRDNPRRQKTPLAEEKVRIGSERLAAALLLCGKSAVDISESEPAVDQDSGLSLEEVLPDWTPSERQHLMTRALFDQPTYGRLQFHHRSIWEYLAAHWFYRLRKEGHLQLPELEKVLFTNLSGRQVIHSGMQPIVGWLATRDQAFRERVVEEHPEVFLEHGDPARLPSRVRKQILRRVANASRTPERRVWLGRPHALSRLANDDLEPVVVELLKAGGLEREVQRAILEMARYGEMTEVAKYALQIAVDESARPYLRSEAISTVVRLGTGPQIESLKKLTDEPEISYKVIRALLRELFPSYLSIRDAVKLARRTASDDVNSSSHVRTTLIKHVIPGCPRDKLVKLFTGIAGLLLGEDILGEMKKDECDPFSAWLWTPLMMLTKRVSNLPDLTEEERRAFIEYSAKVARVARGHQSFSVPPFRDAFEDQPTLRREIFWEILKGEAEEREELLLAYPYHVLFKPHDTPGDFDWLVDDLKSQTELNLARVVLKRVLKIWSSVMNQEPDRLEEVKQAIQHSKELEESLQDQVSFLESVASREASEADVAPPRSSNETISTWKRIAAQLEDVSDAVVRGEAEKELWNALGYLSRDKSTKHGTYDLQQQFRDLGVSNKIRSTIVAGLVNSWRQYRVMRPDEVQDRNFIEPCLGPALTGVTLALERDADVAEFTREHADVASCLALREINGFPTWLTELLATHAVARANLVHSIIGSEERPTTRYFLGYVAGAIEGLGDCVVEEILNELVEEVTKRDLSLEQLRPVLDFMVQHSEVSHESFTALARGRAVEEATDEALAVWCSRWLMVDGEGAWGKLGQLLNSRDEERAKGLVTALGAEMHDEFGAITAVVEEPSYAQPDLLGEMIEAFWKWGPADPNSDAYEAKTGSEKAAAFRDTLIDALAKLGTPEACREMERLIGVAPDKERGELLAFQLPSSLITAATKSARDWSPADVIQLERRGMAQPATPDELFSLTCKYTQAIGDDLAKADFSNRGLLAYDPEDVHESELQKWFASQLRLRGRDFIDVQREVEVDNDKEPDVYASHPKAGGVALEIKPAERYSINALQETLRVQLVGQYLQDPTRSHGILVLFHLRDKKWEDNQGGEESLSWPVVIMRLRQYARQLEDSHPVVQRLRVIGLDCTAPKK